MAEEKQPQPPASRGTAPDSPEEAESQHPIFEWVAKVLGEHQATLALIVLILAGAVFFFTWQSRGAREDAQQAARYLTQAASLYNQVVTFAQITPPQAEEALTQAIDNCQSIQRNYPNTPQAILSLYIEGSCQFERAYHFQGTPAYDQIEPTLDRAIEAFREFRAQAKTNEDRAKAAIALAACYENRGFFAPEGDAEFIHSAIETLDEAAQLGQGTYLEAQALISKARCLEALNQLDEARLVYSRVLEIRDRLAGEVDASVFGSLQASGGYADLAAQRLERIEAGIANPGV